mmetsp:Transcript_44262/g.139636  ORF Transcript_44262/g.139636 Transcript_44262/m.139636 type:complete len:264 (-) Transcript_44262:15-806(-)
MLQLVAVVVVLSLTVKLVDPPEVQPLVLDDSPQLAVLVANRLVLGCLTLPVVVPLGQLAPRAHSERIGVPQRLQLIHARGDQLALHKLDKSLASAGCRVFKQSDHNPRSSVLTIRSSCPLVSGYDLLPLLVLHRLGSARYLVFEEDFLGHFWLSCICRLGEDQRCSSYDSSHGVSSVHPVLQLHLAIDGSLITLPIAPNSNRAGRSGRKRAGSLQGDSGRRKHVGRGWEEEGAASHHCMRERHERHKRAPRHGTEQPNRRQTR